MLTYCDSSRLYRKEFSTTEAIGNQQNQVYLLLPLHTIHYSVICRKRYWN